MSDFKFKQNDNVFVAVGKFKGCGQIVGCSSQPMPIIGRTYMVKIVDGSLPNETYPFDTIAVPENCISIENITEWKPIDTYWGGMAEFKSGDQTSQGYRSSRDVSFRDNKSKKINWEPTHWRHIQDE